MPRLNTAEEHPFQTVQHAAIAITLLREREGQHHVGILHKDGTTDEVRILHLFWHNKLRNTPPKPTYAWITPPIHPKRAKQVAAFCRQVHYANSTGIPYAFGDPRECFDGTGTFQPMSSRWGLTCASFVLGVFHTTGVPLIHYDNWPHRQEGDEEWMAWIIEHLRRDGVPEDHVRRVEDQSEGAIRYRPEEVAGAAAAQNLPVRFDQARDLGAEISEELEANRLYTPVREL